MSLPNFNEISIPSDSEEEEDYKGIQWKSEFSGGGGVDLLVTIGSLASKSVQCSTVKGEQCGVLVEEWDFTYFWKFSKVVSFTLSKICYFFLKVKKLSK